MVTKEHGSKRTLTRANQGRAVLAAATLVLVAACEQGTPTDMPAPAFAVVPSDSVLVHAQFKVCKYGSAANFTFTVAGGAQQALALADGECVSIHQWAGSQAVVSITETAATGITLDSIRIKHVIGPTRTTAKLTGTATTSANTAFEEGHVALFYNTPTPPEVGEGCTPGYWKNHLSSWPVSTSTDFDATFGVNLFNPNITLLTAVNLGGGGNAKLARHAVAAYLNTLTSVNYKYTTAEVLALVQAGNADALVAANEAGCPLD